MSESHPMMSPDELRELCVALRNNKELHAEDDLVGRIAADVRAYRAFLRQPRPQLPPAELAERLPLMGWLIYEASWDAVQLVSSAFARSPGARRGRAGDRRLSRRERVRAAPPTAG